MQRLIYIKSLNAISLTDNVSGVFPIKFNIYAGNSNIFSIYLAESKIVKVYLGENLIYGKTSK